MKPSQVVCLVLVTAVRCGSLWVIDNYKALNTQNCLETANEIRSSINTSVDPCDDFANYVCGGFYDNATLPKDRDRWNEKANLEEKTTTFFRDILEEPETQDNPEYLKKMKAFYKMCMDEDTIDKVTYGEYSKTDIGKLWPTININSGWMDLTKVFEIYERHMLMAFFHYSVSAKVVDTDRLVLKIFFKPKHFSYQDKSMDDPKIKALENYYYEVALELGADAKTAREDAKQYVEYDKGFLEKVVPKRVYTIREQTFSELNSPPVVDFVKVFNAIFAGNSETVDGRSKVVFDEDSVLKFQVFVSSPQILRNRFGFLYAIKALGKTTRNMREIRQRYLEALYGPQKKLERWRECVNEVSEVYSEGLAAQVIKTLPKDTVFKVEKIMEDVKATLKKAIEATPWVGSSKQSAQAKVDKLTVRLPNVEQMTDVNMNKRFAAYKIYDGYYAKTLLQNNRQWKLFDLMRAGKAINKHEWRQGHVSFGGGYEKLGNIMSVSAVKLQLPFYYQDYPRSVLYGSLGPLLEFATAIGYKGLGYNRDGDAGSFLSTQDRIGGFEPLLACYDDQYSKFKIDPISKFIDGFKTLGSNSDDNSNLQIMYWAYRSNIASNTVFPRLALSPDQLFFVSWAKHYCSIETTERTLSTHSDSPESYDRYRIIGSVQNSQEFASAFSCPPKSKMNPDKKCPFWTI